MFQNQNNWYCSMQNSRSRFHYSSYILRVGYMCVFMLTSTLLTDNSISILFAYRNDQRRPQRAGGQTFEFHGKNSSILCCELEYYGSFVEWKWSHDGHKVHCVDAKCKLEVIFKFNVIFRFINSIASIYIQKGSITRLNFMKSPIIQN